MSDHGSLYPIQRAPVPLNVKVTPATLSIPSMALPAVKAPLFMVYQAPLVDTPLAFCSKRIQPGVPVVEPPPEPAFDGTKMTPSVSNASLQILFPPDAERCRPVATIFKV